MLPSSSYFPTPPPNFLSPPPALMESITDPSTLMVSSRFCEFSQMWQQWERCDDVYPLRFLLVRCGCSAEKQGCLWARSLDKLLANTTPQVNPVIPLLLISSFRLVIPRAPLFCLYWWRHYFRSLHPRNSFFLHLHHFTSLKKWW